VASWRNEKVDGLEGELTEPLRGYFLAQSLQVSDVGGAVDVDATLAPCAAKIGDTVGEIQATPKPGRFWPIRWSNLSGSIEPWGGSVTQPE
jgi:hypothetical protein